MPTRKSRIKHADIVRVFAERLKALRLAKSLTQRQVADSANVPLSYISKLESAGSAPGIDLLERLAFALDVSIQELLPVTALDITEIDKRKQTQQVFEVILAKAGRESLAILKGLLERLAESQSVVDPKNWTGQ